MVLARKFAQILGPLRVGEARPVAGLAVGFVERRTLADQFRSERLPFLRRGARAGEREDQGAASPRHQSGIRAKVHTEPPAGTLSVTRRLATLPPRPERTVTYCRPLWVYVMGGALTDDPVLNFHSVLPLSWSSAMNSPVRRPVKSSPPSVASMPAELARSIIGTCQATLPENGSIAM